MLRGRKHLETAGFQAEELADGVEPEPAAGPEVAEAVAELVGGPGQDDSRGGTRPPAGRCRPVHSGIPSEGGDLARASASGRGIFFGDCGKTFPFWAVIGKLMTPGRMRVSLREPMEPLTRASDDVSSQQGLREESGLGCAARY